MGNVDEVRSAGQQKKDNRTDWQKAMDTMSMMALAKGANPQTMLGFALGKWLGNYLNRDHLDKKTGNNSDSAHLDASKLQPTSEYALLGSFGDNGTQSAGSNPILQYGDPNQTGLYGMALEAEGLKNPDGTYNVAAKPKYDFSEFYLGR